MYTILGAGLAGISASYHLGHDQCVVFEKNTYPGGHIFSYERDKCIWDEGPHVSFTKNEYVRELFAKNIKQQFLEYPVEVGNYYHGSWIPHPAQSNLFAVPQPLRDECLADFLKSRNNNKENFKPANYEEWLIAAFGTVFYENFPKLYTEKYWTVPPKELTVDWVGERVFYPNVDDVKQGFIGPLSQSTHYITRVRYPENGGFFSFAQIMTDGMQTQYKKQLQKISFKDRCLFFSDGTKEYYQKLINTIPLPEIISKSDAPSPVKEAALQLNCSSVLLVNIVVSHFTPQQYHWLYVYDTDKYSTRINFSEKLSHNNAPANTSAIQVEVYFSKHKPLTITREEVAAKVCNEVLEMGLVEHAAHIEHVHTHWAQWGNVIFDHERKNALNIIYSWLELNGLQRENDDLAPASDWNDKANKQKGSIIMAGRYAQWKYYWTDDCILRGKYLE